MVKYFNSGVLPIPANEVRSLLSLTYKDSNAGSGGKWVISTSASLSKIVRFVKPDKSEYPERSGKDSLCCNDNQANWELDPRWSMDSRSENDEIRNQARFERSPKPFRSATPEHREASILSRFGNSSDRPTPSLKSRPARDSDVSEGAISNPWRLPSDMQSETVSECSECKS